MTARIQMRSYNLNRVLFAQQIANQVRRVVLILLSLQIQFTALKHLFKKKLKLVVRQVAL